MLKWDVLTKSGSYYYTPIEVYTGATSTNHKDFFIVEWSVSGPVSETGSSM